LGYVKDKVYDPSLPESLMKMQERIRDAVMRVDEDMLRRAWDEIAFRWDVYRASSGSHIKHLLTKL
jgi:hypothetical protein